MATKKQIVGLSVVAGVVLLAFVGGMIWLVVTMTAGPREAAHAFLAKIRNGDMAGAYDGASPAFQRAIDRDEWLNAPLAWMAESTDATFHMTSVTGNQACVEGSLDPAGERIVISLEEAADGQWRVLSFSNRGLPICDRMFDDDDF